MLGGCVLSNLSLLQFGLIYFHVSQFERNIYLLLDLVVLALVQGRDQGLGVVAILHLKLVSVGQPTNEEQLVDCQVVDVGHHTFGGYLGPGGVIHSVAATMLIIGSTTDRSYENNSINNN